MSNEKEPDIQEIIMGERKFLHDLSNQLVVAQGMGNFVKRSIDKMEHPDQKLVDRADKFVSSVNKMIDMVRERRDFLHEHSS